MPDDGLGPPAEDFMICILFLTKSNGWTKHVAAILKKKGLFHEQVWLELQAFSDDLTYPAVPPKRNLIPFGIEACCGLDDMTEIQSL